MRRLLTVLGLALGLGSAAIAGGSKVVVELYTSQGCSSCPPADEILGQLAQNDDIIALGMHVDYWDYLGWKDEFAIAAFSDRQMAYNSRLKSRYRLVTPQMIIHGSAQVAGGSGNSRMLIKEYIEKAANKSEVADLELIREGRNLRVMLRPNRQGLGAAEIQIVHYKPSIEIGIRAGENRGRKLVYHNVVQSWDTVAKWDGRSARSFDVTLGSDEPLAVIVQSPRVGKVIVARSID